MANQMDPEEFKRRIDTACRGLLNKVSPTPDLPSPYDTGVGGPLHNHLANEYARDNARILRQQGQNSRLYYDMNREVRQLKTVDDVLKYVCNGVGQELGQLPQGKNGIAWGEVNRLACALPKVIRDYSVKKIDARRW